MASKYSIVFFFLFTSQVLGWEALPNIPSGRRSQYLVLHETGAYKYGYDTGAGNAAKQSGDANNQVEGHYFYRNPAGQNVDLKYTAGVQGFVPEGLEKIQPLAGNSLDGVSVPVAQGYSYSGPSDGNDQLDDQANTGDASYNFAFDTATYNRQESSDPKGNVRGSYSYVNEAGKHDLSYIAGSNTGFVATSGSLAKANGLDESVSSRYAPSSLSSKYGPSASSLIKSNDDGSYSFDYNAGDHAHRQSGDANGNVQGRYAYTNPAGTHDLSYVAGSATGFQVTGGSLATPNGLTGASSRDLVAPGVQSYSSPATVSSSYTGPSVNTYSAPGDGSYSFDYNAGDHAHSQSGDASGNVKGKYSYTNPAGTHDLSYVAGSATGFQVTGGSLATPNGLTGASTKDLVAPGVQSYSSPAAVSSSYTGPSVSTYSALDDGSYSFDYNAGNHAHSQSGDASGNVKGRYSYTNPAGTHDLSYVAGSATGFQVTGGSLATPNGLTGASSKNLPAPAVQTYSTPGATSYGNKEPAATSYSAPGDGSYSFGYNAKESSRQESSDASGNVQARYSYRNNAGHHDLSYVAGSSTGFQVTGGSLAIPNGLGGSAATGSIQTTTAYAAPTTTGEDGDDGSYTASSTDDQANTGDASYSFSVDTDEYKRVESSDSKGNVKGRYSYTNQAGSHDLSYVAGSETGFVATGGNLADPSSVAGRLSSSGLPNSYLPPTPVLAVKSADGGASSEDDGSYKGDGSYNNDDGSYKGDGSSNNDVSSSDDGSYKGDASSSDDGSYKGDGSSNDDGSYKGDGSSNNDVSSSDDGSYKGDGSSSDDGSYKSAGSSDDEANTGDASYSFTIDTDEYKRQEASDAQGNVKGAYSYKNYAGNHDLSYVAGSATGFLPTSGTLKDAPGLTDAQLRLGFKNLQTGTRTWSSPEVQSYTASIPVIQNIVPISGAVVPSTKIGYSLDNVSVKAYLPPSNDKGKFGYILDTKH